MGVSPFLYFIISHAIHYTQLAEKVKHAHFQMAFLTLFLTVAVKYDIL